MSKPITSSDELLRRLVAGEQLVKCHGIGWAIGPSATPVAAALVQGLHGSTFRLVLGGDGLPGIGTSQTMRLARVATDADLLYRLRRDIREAGGVSEYARRHGVSKGTVGSVEGCDRHMSPGVAALMGYERITDLWKPIVGRPAATQPEQAAPDEFSMWLRRAGRRVQNIRGQGVRESANMESPFWRECWHAGLTPSDAVGRFKNVGSDQHGC
jgi:hypothetical protein